MFAICVRGHEKKISSSVLVKFWPEMSAIATMAALEAFGGLEAKMHDPMPWIVAMNQAGGVKLHQSQFPSGSSVPDPVRRKSRW